MSSNLIARSNFQKAAVRFLFAAAVMLAFWAHPARAETVVCRLSGDDGYGPINTQMRFELDDATQTVSVHSRLTGLQSETVAEFGAARVVTYSPTVLGDTCVVIDRTAARGRMMTEPHDNAERGAPGCLGDRRWRTVLEGPCETQ